MNLLIVWTVGSVVGAVIAGVAVGVFLASFPRAVGADETGLAPRRAGAAAAMVAFWVGSAFYVPQVIDALSTNDPGLDRILSRYLLYLIYSVMLGVGTYVGLRFRIWRTA